MKKLPCLGEMLNPTYRVGLAITSLSHHHLLKLG
jgi:hypothetical protein